MKLAELMQGYTPNPEYIGIARADDFVLAINLSGEANTHPDDYLVAQEGITEHSGSLNPKTADKAYLRTGASTSKVGNQRQFKVSGDMYLGDPFQNELLSYKIKYGTGSEVIKDYVYFNLLTGVGEHGLITIMIDDDPSGAAGDDAGFAASLYSRGKPAEYTYTAKSVTPPNP